MDGGISYGIGNITGIILEMRRTLRGVGKEVDNSLAGYQYTR